MKQLFSLFIFALLLLTSSCEHTETLDYTNVVRISSLGGFKEIRFEESNVKVDSLKIDPDSDWMTVEIEGGVIRLTVSEYEPSSMRAGYVCFSYLAPNEEKKNKKLVLYTLLVIQCDHVEQ